MINRNGMCYFLHIHQISAGACAGMCTCDCTHQMKKTAIVSQMLSLVLMRKFRLTMLKWKLSLSIHLPACPYFSNCDTHKPHKFVMAALNSSQKLATWLLYLLLFLSLLILYFSLTNLHRLNSSNKYR